MKRLPRDQEKELADQAHLLKAWRAWHAEQLQECLIGAHGAVVAETMGLLDQIELRSGAALVDHMRQTEWGAISADVRFALLHQINETIARVRERNGLPGIDDPIPPRTSAFFTIKRLLFPPSPANAGASNSVATGRVGRGVTAACE